MFRTHSMIKKTIPLILILLLAFGLRTHRLTEVPPGLTHDEANHGRDSINILDGVLLFYFPLNYGSEPLYNYTVAGSMALLGENLFALRYVNVIFGVLTVAAAFHWALRAFGRRTALLTSGLIAVSFWPLATSRQALRAGMLPFLATAGVIFFWQLYRWAGRRLAGSPLAWRASQWWALAGFALGTAATLHTYLAARVLWLIYPLFLLYLIVMRRPLFRRIWRPVLVGLLLALVLVLPMFAYVRAHPEADTRLAMLDGPLQSLTSGDLKPVLANAWQAFLALFWPGHGDTFLAYNIPGRPVLNLITAAFFILGLALALWRWRRPAYAFSLIWFGLGISPSLITGPVANTTRNLGALPALFVLPAIGFVCLAQPAIRRWGWPARRVTTGAALIWLFFVLVSTGRDYFDRWANTPDVRAAYQHTMTRALASLRDLDPAKTYVFSSVYPGAAHDPSIARVLLPDNRYDLRWIDARSGLVFPGGRDTMLIAPSSAPPHPAFEPFADELQTVSLRPDDLDPSFTRYYLHAPFWPDAGSANFGGALELLDARWRADSTVPGGAAELITTWRVTDAVKVGPAVPPAFETDVVLFTHVLDPQGDILAQRDSLGAPSWDWQNGDIFIQVHPLFIPAGTSPGSYRVAVGVYDRASGARLPVLDDDGSIVADYAYVVPLNVHE
jgi:4-amino-4-deoxy-L-arabinose transferase-like glycosyltransferase